MTYAIYVIYIILLMSPNYVFAAYQDPIIESVHRESNGQTKINTVFHGDAGEPDVRMSYIINPGVAYRDIRVWAKEMIDDLDTIKTTTALPTLQVGQVIPRVNRIPATETPKQIWNNKLRNYLRIKDAGILGTDSEIAAIKSDLEATYQAGFLAP